MGGERRDSSGISLRGGKGTPIVRMVKRSVPAYQRAYQDRVASIVVLIAHRPCPDPIGRDSDERWKLFGLGVRQETGRMKRMKESYVEGLATHYDPESCAVTREGGGEALTGACIGRVLSRENGLHLRRPTSY